MNGTFWSNTIWYLLLLATSIVVIVITAIKSPNRKFTAVFTLAVLGFTYWIEVVLLLMLDAYTYYPMLTPWDSFQDAVLGNVFSQVSVSTTAVLYCVLNLRGVFIFVFAVIYYLIDVLFVTLGIYVHNWYRSIYTLIGFIPYCWIVKRWYVWITGTPMKTQKLFRLPKLFGINLYQWLYNMTLYYAVFASAGNSLILSQKLIGLQIFRGGFTTDISKDHTSTILIYGTILIVICIILHRWKRPTVYKGGVLLILFACQWVLHMLGIITMPAGWFIFVTAIDLLGFYLWTVFMEHLLNSRQLPSRII